jgi:phenylacetic acid degradation operon negative regulatory protein
MLTLFGDYFRHREGEIGIGSLIRLFSNFGLSEQSVRSAVSRMCSAGLLESRRKGAKSYYSLTAAGNRLLEEGARRIFERRATRWDGTWTVVVYFIPEGRRDARDRLRPDLGLLGFGALTEATWISPNDLLKEVEETVDRLEIKEYVQVFQAKHIGFSDPKRLVERCWDLNKIHNKYAEFVDTYQPKLEKHLERLHEGETILSSDCFVERFNLIHEYRRLPYFDPDLPAELLPKKWLRSKAASVFNEYHELLNQKATEYFKSVIKEY